MNKIAIVSFILTICLMVIITAFSTFNPDEESNYLKMPYTHSFTKAFCNESNLCQDYEIVCSDERVVSHSPITGAVAQFDKSWRDPRSEEMKNRGC